MSHSSEPLPSDPPSGPHLRNLWLLGCGAMGGALLRRWLQSGLAAAQVTVIDPAPGNLPEGFAGRVVADIAAASAAAPHPTLVVLAVKPQMLSKVAAPLGQALVHAPLVVSMLAGVRTTTLMSLLPGAPLIRIMPNTPARIGRGVTALFAAGADAAARALVAALLDTAGRTVWLDDETLFDAVTAVSGSGPAFLFRFMETLAAAGESAGLERDLAQFLALETIAGAAELARQSEAAPATLREQVTSPGGTTEAGLEVLDANGELFSLLRATVRAAVERARELASEADAAVERTLAAREAEAR